MREQGRLTDWNEDRGFGFVTPLYGGPQVFVHVSEFPADKRRPMITDLITYVVEHDDRGRLRASEVLYLAPAHAGSRSLHHPPVREGAIRGSAHHGSAEGQRPRSSTALGEPGVTSNLLIPLAVGGAFFALLLVISLVRSAALGLVGLYAFMSLLAFVAYGSDKNAAQHHRWRTSEATLHILALMGGWPGAFVAQRHYRHKTRKQSFQVIFWCTVALNCAALAWFLVSYPTAPV